MRLYIIVINVILGLVAVGCNSTTQFTGEPMNPVEHTMSPEEFCYIIDNGEIVETYYMLTSMSDNNMTFSGSSEHLQNVHCHGKVYGRFVQRLINHAGVIITKLGNDIPLNGDDISLLYNVYPHIIEIVVEEEAKAVLADFHSRIMMIVNSTSEAL